MTHGITPEGFNKKTLPEILKSITDAWQGAESFGPGFDVGTSTPQGQTAGIFSSQLAECWELLEECYHGADPDAAADYLLTALAGLTGTVRRPASPSRVHKPDQEFSLNAGVTIPAGSLVARENRPDIVFKTIEEISNPGGSPAVVTGALECLTTGPVEAPAGTLTVIVNPISGWTGTENLEDASLGRDIDSDIVLRARREQQLQLRGGSTIGSIRADLLDVESHPELADMRSVKVLENTSDSIVGGMPPHSIEAVIDDGDTPTIDDDLIAQIIWDSKPGGIRTTGGESGTAQDENEDDQIVYFSRVLLKPVYITLTVETDDDFPLDGEDQVKAAIVAYAQRYGIGDEVIALALRASSLSVAGVTDVPVFTLGFSPAPVGTSNLSTTDRERATFSTTHINVTVI